MTVRLYHGSQDAVVEPEFGLGQDHHDFGKGFYMTDRVELAKEWSVYRPKSKYDLIADPQFNRLNRLFNDLVKEA